MKKGIIIAIAAVLCVAIAVTCYFVFFRKKPITDYITTTTQSAAQIFESQTNAEEKNDKKSIVGLWSGTTDDSFYYLFNDDKTGSYTMGDEIQEFTYKDNGESVTIVFKGNSKEHVFKYSIKGNILSIENDFGLVETYEWK